MGVRRAAKLAWVGACCALAAGCGRTERDSLSPFQSFSSGGAAGGGAVASGSVAGGAGGAPLASAGAGSSAAGTPGAAGMPPFEPKCRADMVEVPEASPIAGSIDDVVPSNGCGSGYLCAADVRRTVLTMGTKAADCVDQLNGVPVCGAWSVEREYWVSVPPAYDSSKAYPLVIQAPGCGRSGREVADPYGKREASVIRVGISPGPRSTGKDPTSLEDDCFDVHEGDDSIDWKFYERLYDKLNDEYCFDRRRLFIRGERSGGTLANELGCKYAGDAVRPVRGVFSYDGDFPAEPQHTPMCSHVAVAGLWMQDGTQVASRADQLTLAVSQAMKVAGCQAPDYAQAERQDFLIGGGQATDTCQRILGCDPAYPLVVCPISIPSQTNNPQIQDPAFATFLQLFGPLP